MRLDSLTALRWFAAFAVFTRHAIRPTGVWEHLVPQGATGVSFFFILSGFLLAWTHHDGDAAAAFYRRRFARIYPAFLVAVGVGVIVAELVIDFPPAGQILPVLLLVQAWSPSVDYYYAVGAPLWSLSAEAFFYLTFPLLILGLARLHTRGRAVAAATLVAFSIGVALLVHPAGASDTGFWFIYIFPVTRLAEFALGAVLALAMRAGVRSPIGLAPAVALALVAYLVAGWVPPYLMWVATTLVPFAILIVAAATVDLDGAPSWLRAKGLVRLGLWSYAFYLLHAFVLYLRYKYVAPTSMWVTFAAPFAVSLVAAAILYHVVEHPLEKLLRGSNRSRSPVA